MTSATKISISVSSDCTLDRADQIHYLYAAICDLMGRQSVQLGAEIRLSASEELVSIAQDFQMRFNRNHHQYELRFSGHHTTVLVETVVADLEDQFRQALSSARSRDAKMAALFEALRINGQSLKRPTVRSAIDAVPEIRVRRTLKNANISRRCFELFDGTKVPWEVPSELRRNLIAELWSQRDEELDKCIEDMDAFCSAASDLSDSLKRYRDCR